LVVVVILTEVNIIQPSGTNLTLADDFITTKCEKKYTPYQRQNSKCKRKKNNALPITNEDRPEIAVTGLRRVESPFRT
jgi:3'-phosphoadenosine 5'-phosphosulfate sulfotransferase (PAPS reductase)/FAD synthetase